MFYISFSMQRLVLNIRFLYPRFLFGRLLIIIKVLIVPINVVLDVLLSVVEVFFVGGVRVWLLRFEAWGSVEIRLLFYENRRKVHLVKVLYDILKFMTAVFFPRKISRFLRPLNFWCLGGSSAHRFGSNIALFKNRVENTSNSQYGDN